MNSQEFLLLNIGIAVGFGVWYWSSRSQRPPTKLNLKAEDSAPVLMEPEQKSTPQASSAPPQKTPGSKQLNIMFNYNGHMWDAYEVLGVPAGMGLPEVTRAYQELAKKSDPSSHDFIYTAYKAILDRRTL